jgi:hypothetical protein
MTEHSHPDWRTMTQFEPTQPTKTMAEAIADIHRRAVPCKEAYDDYADGCNRRAYSDTMYDVTRHLDAVDRWLRGDNDEPIAFFRQTSTQEGRDTYRTHYAADALVGALHHMLGAEYHAGLRSLESVDAEDPWRYRDGKTRAEEERLRLSEGITFVFPATTR